MRLILIVILGLTINSPWVENSSLTGKFKFIEVDEQGDLFLVNESKQLIKLNPQLDTLYTFSEKSAEVEFVAPQNALKILIFNKSLNTIQFLDKTLSPSVDELSLDDADIPLVDAIGMSKDNNFWIFDQNEQSLKKFNTKMKMISTSGNVMNLTGRNWSPMSLKEIDNKVYVCDSTQGVLEFDFFGSYVRTIDVKVKSNFYCVQNSLWFLKQDSLVVHDLLLHDERKMELPKKNVTNFAFYKSQFYLLTQEKLYIYGLSK